MAVSDKDVWYISRGGLLLVCVGYTDLKLFPIKSHSLNKLVIGAKKQGKRNI